MADPGMDTMYTPPTHPLPHIHLTNAEYIEVKTFTHCLIHQLVRKTIEPNMARLGQFTAFFPL